MKKKVPTVRKQLLYRVMYVIVPMAILLIISNTISLKAMQKKVMDSNQVTLDLYMYSLDSHLNNMNQGMVNFIMRNKNIGNLENDLSQSDRYFSMNSLYSDLEEFSAAYSGFDGFFVYTDVNNIKLFNYKTLDLEVTRNAMESWLGENLYQNISQIQTYSFTNKIETISGSEYSLHYYKTDNAIIGSFTSLNHLLKPLTQSDYQQFDRLILTDVMGIEEIKKDRNASGDSYIMLYEEAEKNDMFLAAFVSSSRFIASIGVIQFVLFALAGIFVVTIPMFLVFLRKSISDPLSNIIETMNDIQEGNIETRMVDKSGFHEYEKLCHYFNLMMDDIEHLKIDVYETSMKEKESKLRFLQLQSKPHFYLNSINIIYSMLLTKRYDFAQKAVVFLIRYSKYMLNCSDEKVFLRAELSFVENYIEIQRLRYSYQVNFNISEDSDLDEVRIPPLLIHTFVENSVKYGQNDGNVDIDIKVSKAYRKQQTYMEVTIEDKGPGYSDAAIDQIRKNEIIVDENKEEHYGIYNIAERLAIIYGNDYELGIENKVSGGTWVHIVIPFG